ncbi:MAG TPA: phosphatase PAP2 family protein [Mucilaginibacter sp.]|jgi:acid phosphatase (class A)|nr:phosphatase PAP2 family protein [Mucilaginibacter sp.]
MKTKKINSLILVLLIVFPFISYGQKSARNYDNELAPVRGNYKTFESLSPKPKSPDLAIDKLKFPFDQAWADKVLSVKPVYLTNTTLNDFKIPDPPANSSDQTRAELNYLLTLQYSRTMEDITTSIYMSNNPESPSDVGRQIGYWTDPQKLPLTDSLFDKVERDGDFFLWSLKFKYARVRPYVVEPKIHDLEESLASSYPSGHVTYAYIRAFIYEELAPEFKDYFISKAFMMSRARQIIGVHYPSDCEGSRIFARQFVNMLFENEKFRQDFENVKKEWEAKRQESLNNTLGALKM